MEPYRVGALADLILSSVNVKTENGEKKKLKKKKSLGDLFTSRLPPVPEPVKPVVKKEDVQQPESGKKRKSGKVTEKILADENKSPKKKKKVSPSDDFSDDDEGTQEYSRPSLKYQVRHEDSKDKIRNQEEEARTVFVGNLPLETTKQTLTRLFKKFGKIDSIRFRGAARPDMKTTKKVAVITRKVHEKHQRIIAYVRFEEVESAVKSCELNGFELEGNVVRVDMATATPAEKDQKRAVFVGNLPFSIEEDDVRNHFECCGQIESIRLIRDSATGMGKGFGYVNFALVDSVETAIQRNATELLGREIRVGRSVRKPKATINLAEKVKKGKLEKGVKKPVLVNKKVIKIGQKKLREAEEMSFQGQTADGSASGGDLKAKKIKKKKNRGEIKKKKIAEKFAKV